MHVYRPGLLCTAVSLVLALIVESSELSQFSQLSISTLASCGTLLAVPLTHGLIAGAHLHIHIIYVLVHKLHDNVVHV